MAPKAEPPSVVDKLAETFRKLRVEGGLMFVRREDIERATAHDMSYPTALIDTTAGQEFMYEFLADEKWHLCHSRHKKRDQQMLELRTDQVQDLKIALHEMLRLTRNKQAQKVAREALAELE